MHFSCPSRFLSWYLNSVFSTQYAVISVILAARSAAIYTVTQQEPVLFSTIFSSPCFWYLTRTRFKLSRALHRTVCRIMSMATAASAASAWWMHWLFSRQLLADFPRRSATLLTISYILCMHSGARLLKFPICVCVCIWGGAASAPCASLDKYLAWEFALWHVWIVWLWVSGWVNEWNSVSNFE